MADLEQDTPSTQRRTLSVGLVADPGLPTKIVERIVAEGGLARRLEELGEDATQWRIETATREVGLDATGTIPVVEIGDDERTKHSWDLVVLVTDLTRRINAEPILADYSRDHGTALLSVPGLGARRLRQRAEDVLVHLLTMYTQGPSVDATTRPSLVEEIRANDPEIHESFDEHLALRGRRGRLRLLAGMVRANRPWRLVPQLSPALAGAAAGAAFGVFYSNIWMLADAFTVPRLMGVSAIAVLAMTVWLIADNGLWERHHDGQLREEVRFYNISTVLTIGLAVLFICLVLYIVVLAACFAVIPSSHMESTLRHPVGLGNYTKLAWLAVSMGMLAGAVGSGFAGEEAVRKATYSQRSMDRRKLLREPDED